jgi:hypothetical protein
LVDLTSEQEGWNKGRADAMSGAAGQVPQGRDELAYSSSYLEGGSAAGEASTAHYRVRSGSLWWKIFFAKLGRTSIPKN